MRSTFRRLAAIGTLTAVVGASAIVFAVPAGSAQYPGANGMICYSAFSEAGSGLHLIDPDASGDVVLVGDGVGCTFDASGSRVTYVTFPDNTNGNELRYLDLDGPGHGVIATATGSDYIEFSCVSPDGSKVVYLLHSGSGVDLYMRNIDGSGSLNLTGGSFGEIGGPQFSPDGSTVAFSSTQGGVSAQVWAIDVSTLVTTRLTNAAYAIYAPTWKPDGSGFLAVGNIGSGGSIVSVSRDGSTITPIFDVATVGAGNLNSVMVSPDGTKMLFGAFRYPFTEVNGPMVGNPSDLWTSTLDGSDARVLVSGTDLGAIVPYWSAYRAATTTTTTAAPSPVTPKITG